MNPEDGSSSETYHRVIYQARVFARMSPDHKAMLVNEIQKNNEDVMIAMCGDGANDCKALKAADIGLSLSEAEASIAAPFTAKIQNITPMITLLKEGRAALVTSFQVFKYMALYSLIQFTSAILLYNIASNLAQYQYLYIDLLIIIPLAFTMSRSGAYAKLSKYLPEGNLLSVPVLTSVLVQVLIQATFQLIILTIVTKQDWFEPVDPEGEDTVVCYENTAIFLNSLIQYIIVVITFSIGKPWRQPIYRNYVLVFFLILCTTISYLVILVSST